jgi:hypothetical protein
MLVLQRKSLAAVCCGHSCLAIGDARFQNAGAE